MRLFSFLAFKCEETPGSTRGNKKLSEIASAYSNGVNRQLDLRCVKVMGSGRMQPMMISKPNLPSLAIALLFGNFPFHDSVDGKNGIWYNAYNRACKENAE